MNRFRLRAGVSTADISPGPGVELAGYPHYPRHNTGIHDQLRAGCICLDDGRTRIAVVTLDLLFYSKRYVRELRGRVQAAGLLPGDNLMICCSHTHSGPWASGRLDLEALELGLGPDEGYINGLQGKLFQLVSEACGNLFLTRVGMGVGRCGAEQGVGGNRRSPDGPADPTVNVLGVQDGTGAWRACLVSYALHPTLLHGQSDVVSADYAGYLRKYLQWSFPGAAVLFAQGPSGNQSTRYFRDGQSFEEACRIGTTLGVEARRVLLGLEMRDDVRLAVGAVEWMPDLRQYPPKETAERSVGEAQATLQAMERAGAPYIDLRNAELRLLGAEDILGYIRLKERGIVPALLADELPMEIQVIRLGDGFLAGFQGEAFVEFGLRIKEKAGAPVFVLELANGAAPGYIYTAGAITEGGYETDTSMLAPDTGDRLVQAAVALIQKMQKEE